MIVGFSVIFNASSHSGDEADGVVAVAVIATGKSSVPYTVAVTPSELLPVSARELFDYSIDIVQQGMNHDKPYFLNMSSVNMLIFMTNYYTFL